jgi:acetoacetate decarboxylase
LFYKLLYLDKISPITGGRERWGFPKHYADIDLKISKQKTSATVTVNGNVVIEMSGVLGNEIESPDIVNHQEWYVHKRIPSIEQGKMDVDELNAVYVDNFRTYNSRILNADIELKSFPHENIGEIPVIKILKAVYFECDFVLGFGRTEFNFLDASTNSSNR